MIELSDDRLVFTFPEVHEKARARLEFQRTLRIPDDGREYPLPPGLGQFPLRHVDDFASTLPNDWLRRGGVMLPMYQSEALWIYFGGELWQDPYPCAIKVATGKINAVSGDAWTESLERDPQDYMVSSVQPWLDGYCVEKGVIRQFVAMPLNAGYSVEEQMAETTVGGLQIFVCPMKAEAYERIRAGNRRGRVEVYYDCLSISESSMGLAAGGKMRQTINEDPYKLDDWDVARGSRCFVHIVNSMVWSEVTGKHPPTVPPTSREYSKCGLPWFAYYSDAPAVPGSAKLGKVKTVVEMGEAKGDVPLPENQSCDPAHVIKIKGPLKPGQVREGTI